MIRFVFLFLLSASVAFAGEVRDEVERDFPLRSIGQLQVTNMRGDITVHGWALDKIRVKAIRKAVTDDPNEAKRLLATVDFRFQASDGNIELSAEYGRGLDIQQRLREREHPQTSMEMTVYAPANLKLRVWGVDGKIDVKGWNSGLEVRTSKGPISVQNLNGESASLLCPSCPVEVSRARGSVRCMGGTGEISLTDVVGKQIYVESESGAVHALKIRGGQLYVSKSGGIFAQDVRGRIEFHSQQGAVHISDAWGFISGNTDSGDISAKVREWNFLDNALIESNQGAVEVDLPASFSGDFDAWSASGKVDIQLPYERTRDSGVFGPEPANHIQGRVGDSGDSDELLKIFSKKGDVKIGKEE